MLGETALSVVMAKWGTEKAVVDNQKLHKQLDMVKQQYPHLFLTDADINHPKTGVFLFHFEVEYDDPKITRQYCRMVFVGKTETGLYKWRRADGECDVFWTQYWRDNFGGEEILEADVDEMWSWNPGMDPCSYPCRDDCTLCAGEGPPDERVEEGE